MIVKIHPFTSGACVYYIEKIFLFIYFFAFCLLVCLSRYYYSKNENNSMHGTIFYDDKVTRRSHIGCAKTIGCVIR